MNGAERCGGSAVRWWARSGSGIASVVEKRWQRLCRESVLDATGGRDARKRIVGGRRGGRTAICALWRHWRVVKEGAKDGSRGTRPRRAE